MVLKRELSFFAAIIAFGLAISLFAFSLGHGNLLTLSLRLFALNGYIALSIAAIMTPFLKEITLFFKKSFTKVHHYFAAAGLLLISLHQSLQHTWTMLTDYTTNEFTAMVLP